MAVMLWHRVFQQWLLQGGPTGRHPLVGPINPARPCSGAGAPQSCLTQLAQAIAGHHPYVAVAPDQAALTCPALHRWLLMLGWLQAPQLLWLPETPGHSGVQVPEQGSSPSSMCDLGTEACRRKRIGRSAWGWAGKLRVRLRSVRTCTVAPARGLRGIRQPAAAGLKARAAGCMHGRLFSAIIWFS